MDSVVDKLVHASELVFMGPLVSGASVIFLAALLGIQTLQIWQTVPTREHSFGFEPQ